jgi:chromosome segregation protein
MLKSLEITGFKSFGKKAIISIDSPITSVVGPNGSGKSNVVEAVRFVLGEQSMKSLRGKGQSDLLFKGSKGVSPANKLKVAIIFDNSKRLLSLANDMGKSVSLDFDTIVVARELYADGKSVYSIQGTEVRLKDVTDLLSSVHIGSSGHHIISQGEADRLLSASSKERRSMIDDALGLRVYETRIRDAERKLEKAKQNISEIEIARRELAPHLKFLEKQVQKLSEAEEARRELSVRYFNYEKSAHSLISAKEESIKSELYKIEKEILKYPEIEIQNNNTPDSDVLNLRESLARIGGEKSALLRARETLERSLGRTEGLIEALRAPRIKKENNTFETIRLAKSSLGDFCNSIISQIDALTNNVDQDTWLDSLKKISLKVQNFYDSYVQKETKTEDEDIDNSLQLNDALAIEKDLRNQIDANITSIELIEKDESLIRADLNKKESDLRALEADMYKARTERVRLNAEKIHLNSELERLTNDIEMLKEEKIIFEPFLIDSLSNDIEPAPIGKDGLQNERRAIERLRIKLEDVGGGSGGDIVKEFEESRQRDEYLKKELVDIESSIKSLLELISELREKVRTSFKIGVDKINHEFSDFFRAMFGGGNAFLSLVAELKKTKDLDIEENEIDEEESLLPKFERGVEIHVDLPNKKVKELSMLSGGERSLVSIALLFAMSQVNPPPFLVLDETDAALDEANSRRYGDMLERLSKSTQLLVVTHNRETMSRAGTIYGVTMGSDAVSKLLSIEFGDAVKVAK